MGEIVSKEWTPTEIRKNAGALFLARTVMVAAAQDLAKGTVLGKKTADGKFYPYDDTKTDGTQTAVGVLAEAVDSTTSGQNRDVDAPMYYTGSFKKASLTGWDAAAATDLGAREILGDEILI